MTATLAGRGALLVALVAMVVAVASAATGRSRLAGRWLLAGAAALGAAVGTLAWALLTGDFTLVYVADATSRTMSWPYRLGALWGGMEGSLLLWVAILGAFAAYLGRAAVPPPLLRGVQIVAGVLAAAFVAIVLVAADPFRRLAVPAVDGGGLTPVLEHPAMLYHPPLLYLGQTALLAPFALTVAALARRGTAALDGAWLAATRRAAAVAWVLLSVGMLAGAHWAYRELGWGGFWAWDPVENGSLMPWLAVVAFLHGAGLSVRRGRGRTWPAVLALSGFVLAALGGFLTRSGVTDSVHAFAEQQGVGRGFLAVLATCVLVPAGLWWRARRGFDLRPVDGTTSPVARSRRDQTLLLNNALLGAVLLVVAAGTLGPVISGWLGGGRASVAPRYFATFTAPLAVAILVLLGVGPAVGGREGRRRKVAAGGAVVGLAAGLFLGFDPGDPLAFIGLMAGGSSLALRATAWPATAPGRGRAALVAHAGMVILLMGVFGTTRATEETVALRPGQQATVGDYRLVHSGITSTREGRREEVRVTLTVLDAGSGDRRAVLHPGLDAYDGIAAPLPETGLRSTYREDLLVSVTAIDRQAGDEVVVRVFVTPLVSWVWAGGLLVVAGGTLAVRASRRGQGRPAPRPTVLGGPTAA
jgi:cytochrome c-type biogenesis protein CcmF